MEGFYGVVDKVDKLVIIIFEITLEIPQNLPEVSKISIVRNGVSVAKTQVEQNLVEKTVHEISLAKDNSVEDSDFREVVEDMSRRIESLRAFKINIEVLAFAEDRTFMGSFEFKGENMLYSSKEPPLRSCRQHS